MEHHFNKKKQQQKNNNKTTTTTWNLYTMNILLKFFEMPVATVQRISIRWRWHDYKIYKLEINVH